jgi:hypothetical protein
MEVQSRVGINPNSDSYLLAYPSRLCAQAVTKMTDAFSQFTLDMQDAMAEDEPDFELLFEEDVRYEYYVPIIQ